MIGQPLFDCFLIGPLAELQYQLAHYLRLAGDGVGLVKREQDGVHWQLALLDHRNYRVAGLLYLG